MKCPHPGCVHTDGKPCAFAECPMRSFIDDVGDHPDDTGPFVCECCPSTHEGDNQVARSAGWVLTLDGWLCPSCWAEEQP